MTESFPWLASIVPLWLQHPRCVWLSVLSVCLSLAVCVGVCAHAAGIDTFVWWRESDLEIVSPVVEAFRGERRWALAAPGASAKVTAYNVLTTLTAAPPAAVGAA